MKPDHAEERDAGILVRLAYQGLSELGVDADAVIERTGINRDHLYNSQLRTAHAAQAIFWQAAEEVSGDPDIGLHLSEHVPLFKGLVLEYLFLSSPTFGDGLRRMLDYHRLISDAVTWELRSDEDATYSAFDFILFSRASDMLLKLDIPQCKLDYEYITGLLRLYLFFSSTMNLMLHTF